MESLSKTSYTYNKSFILYIRLRSTNTIKTINVVKDITLGFVIIDGRPFIRM